MKKTFIHPVFVLSAVLLFCACDKESKKFEKQTLALSGHYTLQHYSLQEYDENRVLITNINTDTCTAVFDLKQDEEEGSEYSLLNEFRFKSSMTLRMIAPIRSKVIIQLNEDGSETVYWRPDAAEKRLLIFDNQVEGAEYIILTIEDVDKNHRRWTYIESFDGFDGGAQSSLKLKEVFELEREP